MPEQAEALPEVGMMDALLEVEEEKSELDKIFEQFLDPRNIRHNSELTVNEITAFSAAGPMAEKYNLTELKRVLLENLILRVSKGRGGRREWVKIIGRQQDYEETKARGGFMSQMGRRRGGP